MRNFGLLKSIVENALVKTYKTEDFKQIIKEFRDFIKDHKFVGELYVEYGSLMKTKGLNEEVAKEFLGLSVDFIKSTINNNKREFEQFDAWVETLGENVENQYELLDNMVFAKTADDFIKLVESRKQTNPARSSPPPRIFMCRTCRTTPVPFYENSSSPTPRTKSPTLNFDSDFMLPRILSPIPSFYGTVCHHRSLSH